MKLTAIVVTFLLMIGCIGLVFCDYSESTITESMEYDDYIKCSADATATGSLEIVTAGDDHYVHANDIGTGSYTDHNAIHNVDVVKANLIVILICGQSNGAYTDRANPDQVDVFSNLGECYYYGDSTSPVTIGNWSESETYGIYDMMDSPTKAHIGGVDEPLAVTINKESGNKVLVINTCVSGMRISKFLPNSENYVWSQTCFSDAMTNVDLTKFTIINCGMMWIQGEQNPDALISNYEFMFNRIWATMSHGTSPYEGDVNYYSDDYTFSKCVISLVRQYRGVNSCCAQISLSAKSDDVSIGIWSCDQFTYENGLLYNDNTHYTQKGRNIVGVQCGLKFTGVFE